MANSSVAVVSKFAGRRQLHHYLFLLLFSLFSFTVLFFAVSALVLTVGGVTCFGASTSVAKIVDQMSLTSSSCLAQHYLENFTRAALTFSESNFGIFSEITIASDVAGCC